MHSELVLDLAGRTVTREGERLPLALLEFQLLALLVRRAKTVVPYALILRELWHVDAQQGDVVESAMENLRVLLTGVRKKLKEGAGSPIRTHSKTGLEFVGVARIGDDRSGDEPGRGVLRDGASWGLRFSIVRLSPRCHWQPHHRFADYGEKVQGVRYAMHQRPADSAELLSHGEKMTLDPILDITVVNDAPQTRVIEAIGIEPLSMWSELKGLAIAAPIVTIATIQLALEELVVGRPQFVALADPISMPSGAPFRFDLQLVGFHKATSYNELVARVLLRADGELHASPMICFGKY